MFFKYALGFNMVFGDYALEEKRRYEIPPKWFNVISITLNKGGKFKKLPLP